MLLIGAGVAAYTSINLNRISSQLSAVEDQVDELSQEIADANEMIAQLRNLVEVQLKPAETSGEPIRIRTSVEYFDEGIVKIGFISDVTADLELSEKYVTEIIEEDVNAYARMLGSDLVFSFDVRDAQGQAAAHLETVQELYAEGVNMIIGGMWSSQACASLPYCNDRGILLFSPSSTSPYPAFPGDNLFRMSPTDLRQGPVIAQILESRGVEAVVVLRRADSWSDGIYDVFEPTFTGLGSHILEDIKYPSESTEFGFYLNKAEEALSDAVLAYGRNGVAILILSFSESTTMVQQAADFPNLFNATWYDSEGIANCEHFLEEVPEEASKFKIYSPMPTTPDTEVYSSLQERYESLTGESFDFYTACSYDVASVLARAVIETYSVDVEAIKEELPSICEAYNGATGWCKLDENGDRETVIWGIYGYGVKDGEVGCWQYGQVDHEGDLTWFTGPRTATLP